MANGAIMVAERRQELPSKQLVAGGIKRLFEKAKSKSEIDPRIQLNEYVNIKQSISNAFIRCGSTAVFVDSPFSDCEVDDLLMEFVMRANENPDNLKSVSLDLKHCPKENWVEYLNQFDDEPVKQYFRVKDNQLMLTTLAIQYLNTVMERYKNNKNKN